MAAPSGERPERKAIVELGIANAKAQPNAVVGDDGVVSLIIDGVRHQISRNALKHSMDRRWRAVAEGVSRIGDILNASVAVPVSGGAIFYRVAAIDDGELRFVLITEKLGAKGTELEDVRILNSVNVKNGNVSPDPSLTSTGRNVPDGISIANLKAAWEEVFMPGLLRHVGREEGAQWSVDEAGGTPWTETAEGGDGVRGQPEEREPAAGEGEPVVAEGGGDGLAGRREPHHEPSRL